MTVPFSTAVILITVCPTVPVVGDKVTDRVNPSTLPEAGRAVGAVLVVLELPALVVLVVVELELGPALEQPAVTGRARATIRAVTGTIRERRIGSW